LALKAFAFYQEITILVKLKSLHALLAALKKLQ